MHKYFALAVLFVSSFAYAGPAEIAQIPVWANLYTSSIEHSAPEATDRRQDVGTKASPQDILQAVSVETSQQQPTLVVSRTRARDEIDELLEIVSESIPEDMVQVKSNQDSMSVQYGNEQVVFRFSALGTPKSDSTITASDGQRMRKSQAVAMSAAAHASSFHNGDWRSVDRVVVDFERNSMKIYSGQEIEEIPLSNIPLLPVAVIVTERTVQMRIQLARVSGGGNR